jgi:hypothetical protein
MASAKAAPFGRKPYGAAGRRRATVPAYRRPVVARRYASLRHRDSPISTNDPAPTQGAPLAGESAACGFSPQTGARLSGGRPEPVKGAPSARPCGQTLDRTRP